MANATASELPRPTKLDVSKALLARLISRRQTGPSEELLDSFIPLLEDTATRLEVHVEGKAVADGARKALLQRLESVDCDVDTWLRHHESFIGIEARRAVGPHVDAAKALHAAAFADGIAHVDDYIPDENHLCRQTIAILRSPEHAATVAAIGLPSQWTNAWETALNESDRAFAEVTRTRETKAAHVDDGRDAELEFVDIVVRLRRCIDARASRTDKAKIAEGRELLAPLLDALKKLATEKSARATRRQGQTP